MGLEELAGLAIALAGTGMSVAASQGEKSAMNKAANQEAAQQQQFAKKGQNLFEQSLSQSTPDTVKAQQNAGTQQALQEYTKLQGGQQAPAQGSLMPQGSASQLASSQDALVGANVGRSNNANATLQGYNASSVLQGIKDLQAKSALGQNAGFAQDVASILPAQLAQAQQSQSGLAGMGSLLNTIGGLASMYGAVNSAVPRGYVGGFNPQTNYGQQLYGQGLYGQSLI